MSIEALCRLCLYTLDDCDECNCSTELCEKIQKYLNVEVSVGKGDH